MIDLLIRRMLVIGIIIFTFITTKYTNAQELEIFGYFEPQLTGAYLGDEFVQLASNKLRIDLKYQPSEKVTFGANFNYITYHGKTEWNILDFLPKHILNDVPDFTMLGYSFNPYILPFENEDYLDNANAKFSLKYADITAGKQQLSMGSGYAWNPTDIFNKKDITDPTYEQPGHNALRFDIPLGGRINTLAIYAPTEDWKYTDLLFKIKLHLFRFDFAMLAAQKHWTYTDSRVLDPIALNFYQVKTKRQLLGYDVVGELLGAGIWSEFVYNQVDVSNKSKNLYNIAFSELQKISAKPHKSMLIEKDFYEILFGLDYTFDFQTYIMLEYYRNTQGKSDKNSYTFNDWMQYLSAERRAISRHQMYFFVQHPLTDLINLGSSFIFSINDNSIAVIPMITYNIFENVDITAFGNLYIGEEGTVYSPDFGNGGMLRARVYF